MSLTEAEEAEAARKVHATHARIVIESAKKKCGGRSSRGVTIQDTPSAPKPKPATSKPKLKGAQSLTPAEKEAADIMQALKESKKTSKRQPATGGSSEGTGTIPGVPDEFAVVSATSSEGTGTKPGVPGEENDITKENGILEWGSAQESKYSKEDQLDNEKKDDKEGDAHDQGDDHISDTKDTDNEDDETKSDEDEIYKYKIRVHKDEDEEMLNAEAEDFEKSDAEVSDAAKANAEKIEGAKDDSKKVELPPTSSKLSISSGFGDQFLKLSSNTSLVGTVKDTIDAEISSLLDIKIQSEVLHIQSPSVLRVPVSVIAEPTILTPVQETSSAAPVTILPLPSVSTTPPAPQQTTTPIPPPPITTDAPIITSTVPESDTLSAVQLRVAKLEKDVSELKNVDHSAATIALQKTLQKHSEDLIQKHSVKPALESSKIKTPTVNLEKGSEKSALKFLKIKKEQAKKEHTPKFTIKSTDKAALKEYDQKSAVYQTMHADENAMDKRVADIVKDHKRKHDDDEDPPARPNQGKAPSKGSKTGKYASTKEQNKEPNAEVVMDDVGEDVSPTKVGYDKDALKGIKHWGERHKLWHRSQMNKFSKHNVYSTKKILGVKSVSVKKLHGYGHLEEIMVKRVDRQLYKFKEGDFVDLHLNDIEDMLLLAVQHKLFHLTDIDIVDFIVALRMFTRSLVIKKWVEDLHLGVESYQKKLNITSPQQTFPEIEFKELYTPSHKPLRVIYEDLIKQKRVMRADELYKFSDGTLKKVRDELHHRVLDFDLGYNKEMSRIKWTATDKKRLKLMVKLIDK
ncbi:hypothetical protein Tco_1198242 [Tanacetum coccineum]